MDGYVKRIILYSAIFGFGFSAIYAGLYDHIDLIQFSILILFIYWVSILLFLVLLLLTNISRKKKILWFFIIALTSPYFIKLLLYPNEQYYFLISAIQKCFPFSITFNLLLFEYLLFTSPKPSDTHKNLDQITCRHCGHNYSPYSVFCPNCSTLCHTIAQTLETYKNKKYLDFTADWYNRTFRCPHCEGYYKTSRAGFSVSLGPPIQCCKKCQFHFVDNTKYEWFAISLLSKIGVLVFRLGINFLCLSLLFSTFIVPYGHTNHLKLSLMIALAIAPVLTCLSIRSEARASKHRLEANPDYPQLLKKMGYNLLDDKYLHLHKHAPKERN